MFLQKEGRDVRSELILRFLKSKRVNQVPRFKTENNGTRFGTFMTRK